MRKQFTRRYIFTKRTIYCLEIIELFIKKEVS